MPKDDNAFTPNATEDATHETRRDIGALVMDMEQPLRLLDGLRRVLGHMAVSEAGVVGLAELQALHHALGNQVNHLQQLHDDAMSVRTPATPPAAPALHWSA